MSDLPIQDQTSEFILDNYGNSKMRDYYTIGKQLGAGAFGEVLECTQKESGSLRAVKVLRKALMDEDEIRMFLNEIKILKDLDHPNILKLYEVYEDQKRYYIVTDICDGGELFDEIQRQGQFTEEMAMMLMKQALICINYCHKKSIVHRDLKPENILLEKNNKEFDQIKIIDFGTSKKLAEGERCHEKLGTPYYIAPEVLKKNYDTKCDIWTCGVITYILLCGNPPFNGANDKEIMTSIARGEVKFSDPVWERVSDDAKDFINYLIRVDPDDRPTAEAAL